MTFRFTRSPFSLPILFFGLTILAGACLLMMPVSLKNGSLLWIDAIFTATSATCVTGLSVVDTGTHFTRFGQTVILVLIQLGGLGIMTFTGLAFYLLRRRISLTDRVAVGQTLLHDPGFHLGSFLKQMVAYTFVIEGIGAILIHVQAPDCFPLYSSVFHSVSAFCNAGFSLNADSLMAWRPHWGLNAVFMVLIITGGMGFSVLVELKRHIAARLNRDNAGRPIPLLSWYSLIVIKTTLFLIITGWGCIYIAEFITYKHSFPINEAVLSALFQSVTCRTAGFNTLDIGRMTNVSLCFMMILMFIGGASGSCAGGVKISTFRIIFAFLIAEIRGRRQTVIGRFAVNRETLNKSLMLTVFAVGIVFVSILLLNITEGGDMPHPLTRGQFLEIMFEAVSAFATVGISTGITPALTASGKTIIIVLMFIGRLGPILFLAALQGFQQEPLYKRPEESMLIG